MLSSAHPALTLPASRAAAESTRAEQTLLLQNLELLQSFMLVLLLLLDLRMLSCPRWSIATALET